jgi:hypothetical protein
MYYSNPVPGRAYLPFDTAMVVVNDSDVSSWHFKKILPWRGREFALFSNNKGEEIMQSLQAIRFVRCKPGEDNINSKLSNEQGMQIYNRAMTGESQIALAKEFGVSAGTVSDIKNLRARTRITLSYLEGKEKQQPPPALVAKRKNGSKLSPSLARFIRKDNTEMRLNTKQLSHKYCVSQRTIQRILKGEMYKNV